MCIIFYSAIFFVLEVYIFFKFPSQDNDFRFLNLRIKNSLFALKYNPIITLYFTLNTKD